MREKLGELDEVFLDKIDGRYQQLLKDGWFDFELDTSGSLDSVTKRLLQTVGIS